MSWQVMNKPTSEAWIDPWVKFLKSKGVKFNFNHELKKINYANNKILNMEFINNKKKIVKTSDNYCICINPFNMYDILENSKLFKMSNKYLNLNFINNQISFRLGLNRKIKFQKNNLGFILVDSPFDITFYPQEDHWEKNINLGLNGKIKSLWSGTITLTYKKGIKFNKTAINLNKKDLIEEVIEQFITSKRFINLIKKNNNGYILKKDDIIYSEVFEDWYFKNGRLKSKNLKWVNNTSNEEFRPSNKTKFTNLYVAGSHCKTSVNIWTMESSVESGKMAANLILEKYKLNKCFIYKHKSLLIFRWLQHLDNILFELKLPSIINFILVALLVQLTISLLK